MSYGELDDGIYENCPKLAKSNVPDGDEACINPHYDNSSDVCTQSSTQRSPDRVDLEDTVVVTKFENIYYDL